MKRHKWTDKEEQFLKNNVKGISLKELTQRYNKKFGMNLSESAIANRKNKLGLHNGINGGQFVKGQVPYNKGKKWSEYMSKKGQENSRKTTFSKGNTPWATRPVGSERIDTEGYVYKKVAEPNKWKLKHRVIYESMYGNIPTGYKLIFADGNRQNLDIDNLVLVSPSEQLIMNRKHLFSKEGEFTKTGAIIAKVINKTNKLKRKENNK